MFETMMGEVKCGTVAIIYSVPGCGKSTLTATAVKEAGEKGIFIPVVEDGLSPLQKDGGRVDLKGVNRLPKPITKWSDPVNGGFVEILRWLCAPDQLNKFDTIAIDSMNLIIQDLEEYTFNKYFVNGAEWQGKKLEDVKAQAYQFGKSLLLNHMASEWQTVIKALRFLKSHNKTVLITTHRGTRKVKLVDQDVEFDHYTIDAPVVKGADFAGMLIAEADLVGYGKKDVTVANVKKGKGVGLGGTDRVMVLQDSATVTAKCRSNAPEEIPFTWEDLKAFI